MPSKSGKQHRLMALVANDPKAAKRLGISQKVGKEFMKADKGKKFDKGGDTSSEKSRSMTKAEKVAYMDRVSAPFKSAAKKVGNRALRIGTAGLSTLGAAGLGLSGVAERFRDKDESDRYFKRSKNALRSAKRSAKAVLMGEPDDYEDPSMGRVDIAGDTIPGAEKTYRRGGSVKSSASRRADGIAQRGKTRGKFI
jgi:hypothetical protein